MLANGPSPVADCSELKRDALKQIEILTLAFCGLVILWLVSFPTIRRDLLRRAIAGDVVAWQVLQRSLCDPINKGGVDREHPDRQNLPINQPTVETGDASISEFIFEQELSPGGATRDRKQPLRLISSWPDVSVTDVSLTKTAMPLVYSVKIADPRIKYANYLLYFEPEDSDSEGLNLPYATVVQDKDIGGKPWTNHDDIKYTLRSQNWYIHPNKPFRWQELLGILGRRSEEGFEGKMLETDVWKQFLNDSGVKERSVLGVPVDSGVFFSAIGIFAGGITFALIGPVVVLRRCRTESVVSPWSPITILSGTLGRIWSVILTLVAGLLMLAPVAIAGVQIWYFSDFALSLGEKILLMSGFGGLTGAAVIISLAMHEIKVLRRMQVREPLGESEGVRAKY